MMLPGIDMGPMIALSLFEAIPSQELFTTESTFTYRYIRWEISNPRVIADGVQAADFELLLDGVSVAWNGSATAQDNETNNAGEDESKLLDNTSTTKWYTSVLTPTVDFDNTTGITFNGYRFRTANDSSNRDPDDWIIYGSDNGTDWTEIDNVTNAAVTTSRQTWTRPFNITSFPWIVPLGVTSISAVCVGAGGGSGGSGSGTAGGGGGGGGNSWLNDISVTPGETLTITIGAAGTGGAAGSGAGTAGGFTEIKRSATELLRANGGGAGLGSGFSSVGGTGGTTVDVSYGGGTGGAGGAPANNSGGGGGGGTGGYSGAGGAGGTTNSGIGLIGAGGGGGGGGGYQPGGTQNNGGGGIGLKITGANGVAGANNGPGGGGSSGTGGAAGGVGGNFGGGGGAAEDDTIIIGAAGSSGGVRIIWGDGRSYPSNSDDVGPRLVFRDRMNHGAGVRAQAPTVVAGDLIFACGFDNAGTNSSLVQAGWTSLFHLSNSTASFGLIAKIADGTETGDVTVLNSTTFTVGGAWSFAGDWSGLGSILDVNTESTNGNVVAQVKNASTIGTQPKLVVGFHASSGNPITPRTFTGDTPDYDDAPGAVTNMYLVLKLYGTADTPADITIDHDDEGNDGCLGSCILNLVS